MNRQDAVAALAATLQDDLVVTSLGFATNDLYTAQDRTRNFYTMGSMGTATGIALGLALVQPEARVIALDADGSLLMSLGVLATVGRYAPPNLVCLVLDNQSYHITGGQPTHTSATADLATVARGCGIASSTCVEELPDLGAALKHTRAELGPHFIAARVDKTLAPFVLAERYLTRALPLLKYRFMQSLGVLPEFEALTWAQS